MRANKRHEQHPRLVRVLLGRLAQPHLSARRDFAIVGRVHALAGTGEFGHLVGTAALGHVLIAHEAKKIALAVDDMHADLLVGKAVVVLRAAEVQLADGDDLVAAVAQQVVPARRLPVVGDGVVPVAGLVNVLAGGKRRPGRHADGRGCVGVREQRAPSRQRVEIRRLNDLVAVAAGHAAVVLIGHDDQQVHRRHAFRSGMLFVTDRAAARAGCRSRGRSRTAGSRVPGSRAYRPCRNDREP